MKRAASKEIPLHAAVSAKEIPSHAAAVSAKEIPLHAAAVSAKEIPSHAAAVSAKEIPLHAGPQMPSIIIRGEGGNPDRQVIILPYEPDLLWQIPNIAYFRSSGTSNQGCGWLCGTFFPTGGITTKEKINNKTMFQDECVGTMGHLLKMSDITNGATRNGIIKSIDSFYDSLSLEIDKFLEREPRTLYITPSILSLFDAFNTYFLSEQQLILSYRLSFTPDLLHHVGLWGWECTDTKNNTYSLSDFCNRRWGNLPPIDVPSNVSIISSEDACNFIKHHQANVIFEEMHSIIVEDNKNFKSDHPLRRVLFLNNKHSPPPSAKAITAKGKRKTNGKKTNGKKTNGKKTNGKKTKGKRKTNGKKTNGKKTNGKKTKGKK
jgi:hypothetical protein